jgi:hypothetical protein
MTDLDDPQTVPNGDGIWRVVGPISPLDDDEVEVNVPRCGGRIYASSDSWLTPDVARAYVAALLAGAEYVDRIEKGDTDG